MNQWSIRNANQDDISFIYSTWLQSFHYDSWAKQVQKSVFFDNYKRVIDKILLNADVDVACVNDQPNVILGYIVTEPGILHYCFVKEAFRSFGIAKDLFAGRFENQALVTHKTRTATPIFRKHDKLVFNPFLLYHKQGEI